jgi:Trk K+ transport system NAD-binding subunit
MAGMRLRDLPQRLPGHGFVAVALIREGRAVVPRGEDQVRPGDDVYVVTPPARSTA